MKTDVVWGCYVLLCVSFVTIFAQVASLCRPHERFLSCGGCQRTCRQPAPACEALCREGCYCPANLVRNDEGECVMLSQCPPLTADAAANLDTTEPRPRGTVCPPHEEYRYCEPCNRTCDTPDPVCPAQCARGCFCQGELVRNGSGVCVPREECPERLQPAPVSIVCDETQQFQTCGCEATCSEPQPSCDQKDCSAGCYCKPGLVRAPSGKCVKLKQCPQAETSPALHTTGIQDCAPNELWLSCGWCEPTCLDRNPRCGYACVRGCLCRPPLVRHRNGACVESVSCNPRNGSGDHGGCCSPCTEPACLLSTVYSPLHCFTVEETSRKVQEK